MSVAFKYLRLPESVLDAVLASNDEAVRLLNRLIDDYEWEPPESSGLGIADADTLWDAIHYVLDPERRAGRRDTGSVAAHAIRGAERVPSSFALDGIGFTRPLRVHEIATALGQIDMLALATPLADDLQKADQRDAIYRAGEPQWIDFWFEPLRVLYRDASVRSQAVLVFAS